MVGLDTLLTTRNSRLTVLRNDSILSCRILGIDRALGAGLLERVLSIHGNRGELNIVSSRGVPRGIDLI